MSLARDWTRQLYGASGVALLAPATMIIALAVLALGGGFGGLGALGQLFSGPAVPVGSSLPAARVTPRTVSPSLPLVPAGARASRSPALLAAAVRATAPTATRPRGSLGGGSRGGGSAQGIGNRGHGVTPPAQQPTRTPTTPTAPVTPPAQPPSTGPVHTVVNNVLSAGEAVTSQLPAPVAAVGTGALQSLGQTLNQLLPQL